MLMICRIHKGEAIRLMWTEEGVENFDFLVNMINEWPLIQTSGQEINWGVLIPSSLSGAGELTYTMSFWLILYFLILLCSALPLVKLWFWVLLRIASVNFSKVCYMNVWLIIIIISLCVKCQSTGQQPRQLYLGCWQALDIEHHASSYELWLIGKDFWGEPRHVTSNDWETPMMSSVIGTL